MERLCALDPRGNWSANRLGRSTSPTTRWCPLVSATGDTEPPFVDYLQALFAKRPLDLIVSIGAPAAAFVQRHREQLFTTTPTVFTSVEQRRVQLSRLTANDAVVPVWINYRAALENILHVLPDTKNITVVVGTSPIEKFWKEAIGKEAEPLASRVALSWTDHLSFDDLLKHAAAMPPHSVIFWELMILDAAGVVHEGITPLKKLHAVANAPIFSYDESFFGQIVGGPILLVADTSRQTAAVAVRILGGEKVNDIETPAVELAKPMFDWREMQRWGIGEAMLPPGSRILFRNPTVWDQYRSHIVMVIALLLAQGALITWLAYEHWRRRAAETRSTQQMTEIARMNRIATVSQLSAALAHEILSTAYVHRQLRQSGAELAEPQGSRPRRGPRRPGDRGQAEPSRRRRDQGCARDVQR